MNFVLLKASDGTEKKIEINTIEEIMNLIKEYNNAIIFYPKNDYYYSSIYNYPVIQIYDDYIE